jgi:hypothetical protein
MRHVRRHESCETLRRDYIEISEPRQLTRQLEWTNANELVRHCFSGPHSHVAIFVCGDDEIETLEVDQRLQKLSVKGLYSTTCKQVGQIGRDKGQGGVRSGPGAPVFSLVAKTAEINVSNCTHFHSLTPSERPGPFACLTLSYLGHCVFLLPSLTLSSVLS